MNSSAGRFAGGAVAFMAIVAFAAPAAATAAPTPTTPPTTPPATTPAPPPSDGLGTPAPDGNGAPPPDAPPPALGAAPAAPVPPSPDLAAANAVEMAVLRGRIAATANQLAEINQRYDEASKGYDAATAAVADSKARYESAKRDQTRLRALLRRRAADMYQHADGNPGLSVLNVANVSELASTKSYGEAAAKANDDLINGLTRTKNDLTSLRTKLEKTQASVQSEKSLLDATRAALVAISAKQQQQLDDAGGVSVMGPSELTAEQLAAWFKSTGHVARLVPGTTIDDLTKIYIEEGAAENVRGDVAFAQSIIETGYFNFPTNGQVKITDNDFAGMGACDSCSEGRVFPTPRDGVRAQIQHLLNYSSPLSRTVFLHNPPVAAWYGANPLIAAHNFDTFFAKGRAPNWSDMGGGNWATDPFYAVKVLTLHVTMLLFADQPGI